jgi:hypothetical protein
VRYDPIMRYQPVRSPADLQLLARAPEGWALDFKATADPGEWWELAKDVAAFANYVGGTILVGAAEQSNGTATFFGIARATADALAEAYEQAAKDKCKPRPLATTDLIALEETEKVVLAVNVDPFPLGPVGAMFNARNKEGKPTTSDAWRFPMRVGKHNIPLQPDQVAMFMEPKIRRIVTLLEEIPLGANVHLVWTAYTDQQRRPQMVGAALRMISVDVQKNVLALGAIYIPIDDVDAVWVQPSGTRFVRVTGRYDPNSGGQYTAGPAGR